MDCKFLHSETVYNLQDESNVLAFYSNNYFSFDFTPENSSLPTWLSCGIGLCNVLCTIPAFFLIDRGRISLLLATYPFMIVIMLASSLVFAAAGSSIPSVPIIVLAFLFTAVYSLGQGPGEFCLQTTQDSH